MPRRPNKRPDLNGVLVVDKPPGLTSAAVCAIVRRATGGAKIGHAGSLDPMATGVLVLCLGRATKSVPVIMGGEKEYEAEIDLSGVSSTDDAEGRIEPIDVPAPASREDVEAALRRFVGRIEQRPPRISSVSVGGRRAHEMARRGVEVDLAARMVTVHSIDLLAYDFPRLRIDVRSGKGVYIRSIARDLGAALGTGGYLTALRRTRVGPYRVEDARDLDELHAGVRPEDLLEAPARPARGERSTHLPG